MNKIANGAFVHASSVVEDSVLDHNARVYKDAFVKNCILREGAIVGDYTRTERSRFDRNVRLQRNGLIYDSSIGDYSYTGKNCTIWHAEIGKFCSMSWNLSIGGANHDYSRVTTHSFLYAPEFGFVEKAIDGYDRFSDECLIGSDVWIAANVCVCRGVTIGDGAVIGAGAIVTKDVEPYSIVVGNPARMIKKRFDDRTIERLLKIKWWDFPVQIIRENVMLFSEKMDEAVLDRLEEIRCKLDAQERLGRP